MKFLKNIAIAALIGTAIAGNAMSADFELEANGGKACKLNFTPEAFEASVKKNGAFFGAGSSAAARTILDNVSAEIVRLAKEANGSLDDDAIIVLVKAKAAGAEVMDLAMNAAVKADKMPLPVVQKAVSGLAATIVGKLGLKDKDEAAIEAMARYAKWDQIKDVKAANGKTLEELAADPKTAKGVKVGAHDLTALAAHLDQFLAEVEHQKLVAERDHHKAEATRLDAAHKLALKAPKEDPAQKKSHDTLAGLEKILTKAGLASAKELPGYVKDDGAANLAALCDLVVELNTSLAAAEDLAKDHQLKLDAALALTSGGKPGGISNLGGGGKPGPKAKISRQAAIERAQGRGEDHTDDAVLAQHAKELGGELED
jgi:hypothetical protein